MHNGNIGSNADCERVIGEVLDRHGRLDIKALLYPHAECGARARSHTPVYQFPDRLDAPIHGHH
jgi:hypothetical protein